MAFIGPCMSCFGGVQLGMPKIGVAHSLFRLFSPRTRLHILSFFLIIRRVCNSISLCIENTEPALGGGYDGAAGYGNAVFLTWK
ncbi:hypothetical protein GGTG_03946 [Gaeumannomyces tritici R3-111a-1]|uniref:Uncharacterized protein n=1 Tax=Gaeumannomyces tritici (strain R3-111a-1) TaxID=644352 RepID=J3NRP6_GAET3|nr:hypothetical protein GGTG_03946 [Gaeumannomyces tritici R3-111a-1]EJT78852.1 hypothetical protein GGTG_03946 [Gaeumannomyces tritici R3-111a-1]